MNIDVAMQQCNTCNPAHLVALALPLFLAEPTEHAVPPGVLAVWQPVDRVFPPYGSHAAAQAMHWQVIQDEMSANSAPNCRDASPRRSPRRSRFGCPSGSNASKRARLSVHATQSPFDGAEAPSCLLRKRNTTF